MVLALITRFQQQLRQIKSSLSIIGDRIMDQRTNLYYIVLAHIFVAVCFNKIKINSAYCYTRYITALQLKKCSLRI